jgi:hypothetical protein
MGHRGAKIKKGKENEEKEIKKSGVRTFQKGRKKQKINKK